LALHGDGFSAPALAEVVHSVTHHRLHGQTGHPLSRLAQERLLRARLVATPSLIGASSVELAQPPVRRMNLKDPTPCTAVAVIAGVPTVVVCTTGVDLDAVPYAVDARSALGIEACLVVMPARDAIDLQRLLAATAAPPVTIVPVD
jgi:hypothetical protein